VLSLAQAAKRRGAAGVPLPTVYRALEARTIRIYRSQLTLVIGQGGSGKSLLTANLLAKMKVPSLAILLDQDQLTASARMVATVTGDPFLRIKDHIDDYDHVLWGDLGHIQAAFKAEGMGDIRLQLDAYMQRYGEPPHVLLLDNLGNMASGFEDEWSILRGLTLDLDELAREYEMAVIGCAHTSDWDRYDPPPRKMLLGKTSQYPRLIISVGFNPLTGEYKLAAVKNSSGEADLNAVSPLVFSCDPVTMQVMEQPPLRAHPQVEAARTQQPPYWLGKADVPLEDIAKGIIERQRDERQAAVQGAGFGGF
jgi:hypothetical protein